MLLQDSVGGDDAPGLFGAIVLGIVEGLTEFLPVSSTGHLIVANRFLGDADGDPTFEVVVQIGAISAIAWLYRERLWGALWGLLGRGGANAADGDAKRPRPGLQANLLVTIVVAALPAIVLGLLFGDAIEAALFDPWTVVVTMVAGGVLLLVLESWLARRPGREGPEADVIGLRDAFLIGLFQCLALVPGTSRSGATIAGALILGRARGAAAEFSFLVGLPILYGAGLYKGLKDHERVLGPLLLDLLVGMVASFVTALVIVGPFVRYLRGHTFRPFAVYRIVAGVVLAALLAAGLV